MPRRASPLASDTMTRSAPPPCNEGTNSAILPEVISTAHRVQEVVSKTCPDRIELYRCFIEQRIGNVLHRPFPELRHRYAGVSPTAVGKHVQHLGVPFESDHRNIQRHGGNGRMHAVGRQCAITTYLADQVRGMPYGRAYRDSRKLR